ncbi:TonB-dependent receptor [Rhodocytophaga rosea]|uniref:TonB-dependent receptor n=1 Tax=Rhodocytophaga rosea TaxID=2704465 RepID=A0A6C0GJG0_9BACT|nr:outer membrane beta-barrel family protein [Rhodocytophaga rosea]QHT67823.1 TonB-dependent receptor [Rhodocytophaga rosea]
MKFFWTLLLLIYFSSLSQAQNTPVTQFIIKGKIVDEQKQPVPFGNIALYQTSDSTLTTGAVSEEDGTFSISTKPGSYYIKITVLSYRERVIKNVQVSTQDVQLGVLTLKASAEMLEEVVVKGQKSQMEMQLDKRVFNIGQDLANIGGNAAEILDNVPSVAVDVEGNVSLRGSQNVRILIDGKPSGLAGISSPDALRQLQGNMIERVEVITNPSSRYDAEGEVGIINIVLKKNVNQGVNGSFTANVGYPDNYGGSFDVSYRKNKINLFSSYGFNYRSAPGYGSSFQQFNDVTDSGIDTTFSYSETNKRTRGGTSHNFRVGMDYYLNDKNILTGSFLYRRSDGRNSSRFEYSDFDGTGQLIRTVYRSEQEKEPEDNIELALSYRKEFAQKGRSLTADFKWIETNELELASYIQEEPDATIFQRASNTEDERNALFQVDYIHPIGEKGKWEAGLKSTNRLLNNDFLVEELAGENSWVGQEGFDNYLTYTENIHAAYLMAGNQFRKFSLQAGVRGEFSDIIVERPELDEKNIRRYFNLFPSAHLSYEINKSKSVQLSYSYRLSRPGFRELLPFSGISDARSIMVGNPRLNPEYTHSLEGGYLLNFENGSLLSSAYYRYRTGVIQRISIVDSIGFRRMFPVNLATQNAYGLEFNASYTIQNWWRLNGNINFYRAITSGSFEGQSLYSDAYTWTTRATSKMTFFKRLDFQAGINYRAPQDIPQGRELSSYSIDLGLSTDVLKGRGTLTLNVRDLLNTRKRRLIIEEEGQYSNSVSQGRVRQTLLTFTYRLNQQKDSKSRERDSEDDSENGG